MSSVYQPKNKELAKVKVVSTQMYSANRSRYRYIGSVNRGFTNFVTTKRNLKTGQASYIDDTSSLTKRTKNEITNFFSNYSNRNKGVAYLVVPKTTVKKGKNR